MYMKIWKVSQDVWTERYVVMQALQVVALFVNLFVNAIYAVGVLGLIISHSFYFYKLNSIGYHRNKLLNR